MRKRRERIAESRGGGANDDIQNGEVSFYTDYVFDLQHHKTKSEEEGGGGQEGNAL